MHGHWLAVLERLTAVSPMLAEATVLGAEDLELGARRGVKLVSRISGQPAAVAMEAGDGR